MREVHLVRAYCDAPVEVFASYATAWLRKCALDVEYGGYASIETVPIEDFKLQPSSVRKYGPSNLGSNLE